MNDYIHLVVVVCTILGLRVSCCGHIGHDATVMDSAMAVSGLTGGLTKVSCFSRSRDMAGHYHSMVLKEGEACSRKGGIWDKLGFQQPFKSCKSSTALRAAAGLEPACPEGSPATCSAERAQVADVDGDEANDDFEGCHAMFGRFAAGWVLIPLNPPA